MTKQEQRETGLAVLLCLFILFLLIAFMLWAVPSYNSWRAGVHLKVAREQAKLEAYKASELAIAIGNLEGYEVEWKDGKLSKLIVHPKQSVAAVIFEGEKPEPHAPGIRKETHNIQ